MVEKDLATLYRRSVEQFAERVRSVRPEQWAAVTPCSEWDVRALVNHVVGEDRWAVPLMAGQTIADVGDRFEGDLLGADPAGTAVEAAKQAEYAVSDPGALDRTVHLSFGDTPAEEYVHQLLADHLVHGWDLAKAIGADDTMDTDVLAEVTEWFMPSQEMWRQAGVIGPAVPLPRDASDQDRLLAAFGRARSWTPPLQVLQHFGEVFNRGDVDAIMALMTEDCVFESTNPAPDGVRMEGALAVRAAWERLFAETTEPHFTTEDAYVCGDRGTVLWTFTWKNADGSDGRVRGVDVLRLRDGKIAEKFSYVKG